MSEQGPGKVDLMNGPAADTASPTHSGSAMDAARTIGAMLREARLAQGLPLDEISVRLKVPMARLAMVEDGDLDGLLDVTFAQGLMRAYGRVVNVELGDLPARLKNAQANPTLGLRPESGLGQKFSGRSSMDRPVVSRRWLWTALVVICLAALVLFSLERIQGWVADQSDVLDNAGAVQTLTGQAPAELSVASEPGMVSKALPAGALQQGTASVPELAASGATETSATVTPPIATSTMTATGDVVMQFSEPVWFEVRDQAGKILASGTGRAGEERAVEGTAPFSFVFGNARGVAALKVAGQTINVAEFARNNVARMKLPQ
jgi:cytoskeleton protein RodZ